MSAQKKSDTLAPRPEIAEAEQASSRCLDIVTEIFGFLDDESNGFEDDEPTIIRRLKNGGRSRLARRLRLAGFAHLQVVEAESA